MTSFPALTISTKYLQSIQSSNSLRAVSQHNIKYTAGTRVRLVPKSVHHRSERAFTDTTPDRNPSEMGQQPSEHIIEDDTDTRNQNSEPASPKAMQDSWDLLSVQERWKVNPNRRAREVTALHPSRALSAIQREIQQPEYTIRDAQIRDSIWKIMDQVERFVQGYFGFKYSAPEGVVPQTWLEELPPQTAKIISCVASGGPNGVQGWHDLFIDQQKRQALCNAIIYNVLVEQVFKHIVFGGTKNDLDAMMTLVYDLRNEDGFVQNERFAVALAEALHRESGTDPSFTLPDNFRDHVNHTVGVLYLHLYPFFQLDPQATASTKEHSILLNKIFDPLFQIVVHAGIMSLHMRLDPHTVYYFEPVFKEDDFDPERMHCFNADDMMQRCPHLTPEEVDLLGLEEKQRRANLSDAEKERARNDEAITQITIMEGICAYRPGGWETAESTIENPVYEVAAHRTQGMRERLLTDAWVYCRWGRPRGLKDGETRKSTEGVQGGFGEEGFAEFADVKGIASD